MARYKECTECDGEGRIEYAKPIVDWNNGGDLKFEWGICHRCDGAGEVETDEE